MILTTRADMGNNLIELAQEKYDTAGAYQNASYSSGMASLFMQGMGAVLDYSALKQDLKNYNIQASNVQLQAMQRANQLRQSYLEAAGNYVYNAARRGIRADSGSVRSNLEASAQNLGKDIVSMQESANMQARTLQAQRKIKKYQARAGMTMKMLDLGFQGAEKTAKMVAGGAEA